jgi:mRNA interferase RelE/StbE
MSDASRVTVYFEPDINRALKLRAASSDGSVSEMVNHAVRLTLAEDAGDLEAFEERANEPERAFEDFRYSLRIKDSAAKEIERVEPKNVRRQGVKRVQSLATNPRPPGCEKLAGTGDRYRVRQGAYRIVYEVRDEELAVVVNVGYRSDVYTNP